MGKEVFGLESAGDIGSWGHARAFISGSAEATASFRRGISLTADVPGQLGAIAELKGTVVGSVSVGAEGAAGVALQAQVPLDLFGQFGLVARVQASARATVWIRAEAGLSTEALEGLVRGRLEGPWRQLSEALLREFQVKAGFVARASVAAEAYGRLVIAGSFVKSSLGDPGFDVIADAGFAFGAGAGYAFVSHLGIEKPERLVDTAASVLEQVVTEELRRASRQEPAIADVLPLVPLLVPLTVRSAYHSGIALTQPVGKARDAALRTVGAQFARGAADALTNAAIEWAIRRGSEAISRVVPQFPSLSADEAHRVRLCVETINAWVSSFSLAAEAGAWATPAREITAALWDFVEIAAAHKIDLQPFPDILAAAWAATALAALREQDEVAPPPPALADHLRTALNYSKERAIDPAAAAAYLLSRLDDLTGEGSPVKKITQLFEDLPRSTQNLVIEVGFGLSALDDTGAFFTTLAKALVPVLREQLIPAVESARQTASGSTAELLGEVALPALRVLAVLLPDLPRLRTASGDDAVELRERVSVALVAVSGRVAIVIADCLLEYAMTNGATAARALAADVRSGTREDIMHRVMAGWEVELPHVPDPDRQMIGDLVVLGADMMQMWNDTVRPDQTALTKRLLSAITAVVNPDISDALADPSYVVGEATLQALAERTGTGIGSLVVLALPRIVYAFGQFAIREVGSAENVLRLAADTAKQALDVVIAAAEDLLALADRLGKQIKQDMLSIDQEIINLTQTLQNRIDGALDGIREQIWSTIVSPALTNNPVFAASPSDLQETIRNGLRGVYESAFNSIRWALEEPLMVLRKGAQWVRDILMHQIDASSVDGTRLLADVRSRALRTPGTTIQFPLAISIDLFVTTLTVDLGTVSVGVGSIVSSLVDEAFALMTGGAESTVDRLVNRGASVVQATHQRTVAIQSAAAASMTAAQSAALTTGQAPTVSVTKGARIDQSVPVDLAVGSINASFLSPVANVPRRLKLTIDGRDVDVDQSAWDQSGATFSLRLALTVTRRDRVPVTPLAESPLAVSDQLSELELDGDTLGLGGSDVIDDTGGGVIDDTGGAGGNFPRPIHKARLFGNLNNRRAAVPGALAAALRPGAAATRRGLVNRDADIQLTEVPFTASLPLTRRQAIGWIEDSTNVRPSVPIEVSTGPHLVAVTVADGAGRSASGSCAVIVSLDAVGI